MKVRKLFLLEELVQVQKQGENNSEFGIGLNSLGLISVQLGPILSNEETHRLSMSARNLRIGLIE